MDSPSYYSLFMELPEPFNFKAVANCKEQYNEKALRENPDDFMVDPDPHANAIRTGFNWHKSNEGNDYWMRVCHLIKKYGVSEFKNHFH